MEPSNTSGSDVRSAGAFRRALSALVNDASENGVDVRGEWSLPRRESGEEWSVDVGEDGPRTAVDVAGGDYLTAVVEAVAAHAGVEASALPPLYDAIDPDVVAHVATSGRPGQRVVFTYAGCRVAVGADGTVVVED